MYPSSRSSRLAGVTTLGKSIHVVSADAEKIVLAPNHGPPLAFRVGDVARFRGRRVGRGFAIGAGVGAAIGALEGFFTAAYLNGLGDRSGNDPPDTSGFPVGPALEFAAAGALIGAVGGAVIGAFIGSREEFPVVLGPAPPSEYVSSTPASKLALAPPPAQRAATVTAPSAEVRSAPFKVAPVIATLAHGQRLYVDPTPNASWRVAFLSDGRTGYIQDAQVEVDLP
jgi:hypothetical protein